MKRAGQNLCPCGGRDYRSCCGRYHHGEMASNAEILMRSRYSAYALRLWPYLLDTWHPQTRPVDLGDDEQPIVWTALRIDRFEQIDPDHAVVEFVARFKLRGKAYRHAEISRFVREGDRWFYLDAEPAT